MKKLISSLFFVLTISQSQAGTIFSALASEPIVEFEPFTKTICTNVNDFDYKKAKYDIYFGGTEASAERVYKFFLFDMANIYGDDFVYEKEGCFTGVLDGNLMKLMTDNDAVSSACYGEVYYPIPNNQNLKCKDAIILKKVLRIPRTNIEVSSLIEQHCPDSIDSSGVVNEASALQCMEGLLLENLINQ